MALVAVLTLALPTTADASTVSKSGSVSCNYGWVGLVTTYPEMDVDGWAPRGYQFRYDWGTWTWQTHYKSGSISGSWFAESSGLMDMTKTYTQCT